MFFVRQLQEVKFAIRQKFPGLFSSSFWESSMALSKYSPVTLHYSLAPAIVNETPGFKNHILSYKLSH